MLRFKKLSIPHPFLLILNFWLTTSIPQHASTSIYDELKFQTPFSKPSSTALPPINQMIICKSQKPYNVCKTRNISHSSCLSSFHYASPQLFSADFVSELNSLLLYNCSNSKLPSSPLFHTFTCLHTCGASSNSEELDGFTATSCLLVDDLAKLEMEFKPSDLNCSCYGRVYIKSPDENNEEHDLRTRIAFDVPDHIPNICNECQKANGNCGAALRCICHPKECKNKVISTCGPINSFGNYILVCLLPLVVASDGFGSKFLRPRKPRHEFIGLKSTAFSFIHISSLSFVNL